MEVDHLIPEASGGLTEEDNLWLACFLSNVLRLPVLFAGSAAFATPVQNWVTVFCSSDGNLASIADAGQVVFPVPFNLGLSDGQPKFTKSQLRVRNSV